MSNSPRRPGQLSAAQRGIRDALHNISLPKAPTTAGYRAALAAVCLAMLLVPLLYLGLLGLVAHAAWWSWTYAREASSFYGYVFFAFSLLTIASLIKPVFVKDDPLIRPSKLKREAEPFLFDYVDALCRAVDAPTPESIRIDCDANASASLSRGLLSVFSRDVCLTIGLPLSVGLSVREFTGVLAHEFGHFSQGYGMRATALVRATNYWIAKAAYRRDRWDHYLVVTSQSLPLRIGIFFYAARGLIWLSRRLLAFIAFVTHALSCALLRQMEYDADRYEVGIVGSETFVSTARKLRPLALAQQMALNDAATFYQEDRLADEFAKLVATNVPALDKSVIASLRDAAATEKTGWFDSHPTDRDRVAAALAIDAPGELKLADRYGQLPASALFSNFSKISKGATYRLYRRILGEEFDKTKLCPSDELIERRDAERAAGESLDRYFQVHIPILRPLRIAKNVLSPPESAKELAIELQKQRRAVGKLVPEYEALANGLAAAENAWLSAAAAQTLVAGRVMFEHREFGVRSRRKADVLARMKQTDAAVQNLALSMMDYEDAAERRLSSALRLLRVPKVVARINDGANLAATTAQLVPDSRRVSGLMRQVGHIRVSYRKLAVLIAHLNRELDQPDLYQQIEIQIRELSGILKTVRAELGNSTYPFDHADDTMTIARYVLPYVPEDDDIGGLIEASRLLVERLAEIQMRLFAKLTFAAEQVEQALSIAPLRPRKRKATIP